MNWIEKMIAEQCPNGVKKVKLGEVCEKITDGSHNLPPTVEFSDFRMISSQNIYNTRLDFHGIRYLEKEGYEKENKRTYVEKDNVLLTIVGAIGRCYVVKKEDLPFTCQRSVCVIKLNKDKYNPYFLHECIIGMSSTLERQANGAAQKGLYLKQVAQIEIPLPPLSIQKEIVSVLDKFSELIEKTDEEIALRQKQYEYYREKLLTFEEGEVEWKKLGDVALIGTGSRNTQDGMNVGQYPFYTRGQEILRLDEYDYNETAIITAGDGAGVGKTFHFVKGCYALHQRAYRFVANEQIISPKFLYNPKIRNYHPIHD